MKIAIAQTRSILGEIQKNTENHVYFIHQASDMDADMIVFPEMSITNYTLQVNYNLLRKVDLGVKAVFQKIANQNDMIVCIGLPTGSPNAVRISMRIFIPHQKSIVYSKMILHPDETPYFVRGDTLILHHFREFHIGFGICHEALQSQHTSKVLAEGANVYIASVAKSGENIRKSHPRFATLAKTNSLPVFVSNSIGPADNFCSGGQSAVWDQNGDLKQILDDEHQGLFTYDLISNKIESMVFNR